MDKNLASANIEGALVWICCLSIDIMQTCDTELPLFVPRDSIELSLTLPNISIEEFLSKVNISILFIQLLLIYHRYLAQRFPIVHTDEAKLSNLNQFIPTKKTI
jgi:hypothetical protein